ncbi:hypothetical protein KM043_004955 [Ampulex compressa]|nr:hypothetical protein KM043_004955 [Ampulex compressa]
MKGRRTKFPGRARSVESLAREGNPIRGRKEGAGNLAEGGEEGGLDRREPREAAGGIRVGKVANSRTDAGTKRLAILERYQKGPRKGEYRNEGFFLGDAIRIEGLR